jgi:hypothetical protein
VLEKSLDKIVDLLDKIEDWNKKLWID